MSTAVPVRFTDFLQLFGDVLFAWGWIVILFLVLWIAWETYLLLKRVDYVSSIQWTFLEIRLPEEAPQTPKAMENAFNVWGGIHKAPDLVERFFEGYVEAWYSLELHCEAGRARYILVVPTAHRKFFEGVIYGQYPTAEVTEVEDYTLRYDWRQLRQTYEMWGSEIVLSSEDIYPVRMYREFEDMLAEDDRYVDPHQAMVEAYTNLREGEEIWVQILVRPIDATDVASWSQKGEEKISEISGQKKEVTPGILKQAGSYLLNLPLAVIDAFVRGPVEEKKKDERIRLKFATPAEDARMKGILQKVGKEGYRTKIRTIYLAPRGKLHKPMISLAIGGFKQFNTFNLNSFKPDSATKTNGPQYILRQVRRKYRERRILLLFQWRDFFGANDGFMMTAEELATIYHFPSKYLKAPALQRATAGLGSPPPNIPYV